MKRRDDLPPSRDKRSKLSMGQAEAVIEEDWDKFELEQQKKRAEIRIREGRGTMVDIIYNNVQDDTQLVVDTDDPTRVFKLLSHQELAQLLKEIQIFSRIPEQQDFWKSLEQVCKREMAELSSEGREPRTGGFHSSVVEDIHALLEGKTYEELCELEGQVEDQLNSGGAVDVEYWETLLKELQHQKLRTKVTRYYAERLEKKLSELEPEERELRRREIRKARERREQEKRSAQAVPPSSPFGFPSPPQSAPSPPAVPVVTAAEGEAKAADEDDPIAAEARRLEAEARALLEKSQQLARAQTKNVESLHTEEELYKAESERPIGDDEEPFNVDIPLPPSTKPSFVPLRKPKYFNRVIMGIDWNKYNQTHYDEDNPPPKVVFGYRFNIFYPDLIDKTKTPTFKVIPEPGMDTALIRFHAGPPYEDIAFRILNREWEKSQKQGYKSSFERGVLHLWFNLKKYKYKR